MTIVPYESWHIRTIQMDEQQMVCYGEHINYIEKMLEYQPVFTVLDSGIVVLIAGYIRLWVGVYEAVIFVSKKVFDSEFPKSFRITLLNKVKSYFDLMAKNLKCHRIQASVDVSFTKAIKLAEFLGFKYESTMQMFGPNKEDYFRFVILKE